MKHINMTPYQPYRKMGQTCELREIGDKKVTWPLIDHIDTDDPNFRLRTITRNDVDAVAELWRTSYPEVYGSVHEWILDPEVLWKAHKSAIDHEMSAELLMKVQEEKYPHRSCDLFHSIGNQ